MARPAKLDLAGRAEAFKTLPGWIETPGRDAIKKTFKFKDFSEAFAFMTRAAMKAEQMDHHPEWSNVYNRVEVVLTTHDADGLTQRDVDLARAMEAFAS